MSKHQATQRSDSPVRLALSVDEAADAVGISRVYLYAELKAGRLASKKIGKRRLIPVAALQAWLDAVPAA